MRTRTNKFIVILAVGLAPLTFASAAIDFDLLWGADTYRPPFFPGHSLATPQSKITVTAMFTGAAKAEQLKFNWWKDGQFLSQSSGLGKDTIAFKAGDIGAKHRITLKLYEENGQVAGEKNVELAVVRPRLVIYEDDPLAGINYHRAVGGSVTLAKPEISLFAEPYYFPRADVVGRKIELIWQLGGKKVAADPADGRSITFASAGSGGESEISVQARSENNVFQEAKRTFKIFFGPGNNFTL